MVPVAIDRVLSEPGGVTPHPQPISIDCRAGWCAGWYHRAALPERDVVVVLCPPIGHEAVTGYGILLQIANHLASQGVSVLRFDYHGTGDSSGAEDDGGRVAAWMASIEAAASHAAQLSGASQVALLGVRLGALLALEVSARARPGDNLVLWAPCPSGGSFVRELRMGGNEGPGGSLRAQGYWYSSETLRDLVALDPGRRPPGPGTRVLTIGRDDLPLEQPLVTALRTNGADIDFRVLPGYCAMLQNGRHAGRVDGRLLEPVTAWLLSGSEPRPAAREGMRAPASFPRCVEGVRETLLQFGRSDHPLCGVLSEPVSGASGAKAVLLLNAGHAYRIGPHRMYVTLARRLSALGHKVLRMDLAGVGDSAQEPSRGTSELYSLDSIADVRRAIDQLELHGIREFVLAGLCSGAYLSFQTSLCDPRVSGLVLMNPRLLQWAPAVPGESWESSRELYPKPARAYVRALLRISAWRRLLTGDVSLGWIAKHSAVLAAARLRRAMRIDTPPPESPLARMRRLCQRGTAVLLLVADDDESRQYLDFHFGHSGSLLRRVAGFRMTVVRDADHTFTRRGNVDAVSAQILDYLEANHVS